VVPLLTNHPLNARVNYHHRTGPARRHLAIKRSALQRYAESGSLDNGVLLRMQRAHAMLRNLILKINDLTEIMPNFVTVWQPCRSPNVTRGHDSFVFYDDAAGSAAVACGASGNGFAEV
jgi:hypothetical protein